MIFKGRKVLDGTLSQIYQQYGQDTVRVRLAAGAAALNRMAEIDSLIDHGNYQDVRLKAGDAQEFLRRLVEHGGVEQFEITKPSLHDLFVRIARPTADDLRAEAVSA
jgi:ABC-2 type transport system ATP-binding protein